MSTQDMPAFENGLFFMGMYKLMEYPEKIRVYLDGSFARVFSDPWADWNKIQRVFGTFGTYKSQENASFSKHPDQGDSQKGQYFLSYQNNGILVQMYEIAKKLDILIDPDDVEIKYKCPPTPKEIENMSLWRTLASQFRKIIDISTTMKALSFAIAPLYQQTYRSTLGPPPNDFWDRSPVQMKLYNSYLMGTVISMSEKFGGLTSESCIYKVPWNTTNAIFPSMISSLTNDWWYNLIVQNVVNTECDSTSTLIYTFTDTDILNGYFAFNTSGEKVVHTEYMIKLPEDDPADIGLVTKSCFGVSFGMSLLYPCDVCKYAEHCRDVEYVNPSLIDYFISNRVHYVGLENDRLRILYKNIEVVV